MDEMDLVNERRNDGQQKYERRPSKPEVIFPGSNGVEPVTTTPATMGLPIPNGGKSSKGSPFVGSPRRGSLGNGVAGYPSLAHLLRYEVGSSSSTSLISSNDSPKPRMSSSFIDHSHHHYQRKDRYINSNFKFIYCRTRNNALAAAVDEPVDWERVERAIVPVQRNPFEGNAFVCPICLDVPVLPKLTQCGHVFCQLCLLRLAALTPNLPAGSKWWRTCPVCWEEFNYSQVKSVQFVEQADPSVMLKEGLAMDFVLLSRKGMVLSEERFNRIQFVGLPQIISWLKEEIAVIQVLLLDAEPISIDHDILSKSAESLQERLQKLQSIAPENVVDSVDGVDNSSAGSFDSSTTVWFHQAADGQQLFLHPLTIKILKKKFGSYSALPPRLSLPILEIDWLRIETHTDIRKRLKHLSHLPVGTHFGLAELDLSSMVPSEWLAEGGEFGRECLGRAKERALRKREEEAQLVAFQREEQEKLYAAIHSNILHSGAPIPDAFRLSANTGDGPLLLLDDVNFPSVFTSEDSGPLDIPKAPRTKSSGASGSFASVTAGTSPILPTNASSGGGGKKKGKGTLIFNNDASRQRSR